MEPVVISVSKIEISKAIHNLRVIVTHGITVVISVSKIEISKAIHNMELMRRLQICVVISVSKIEISKAIHNILLIFILLYYLVNCSSISFVGFPSFHAIIILFRLLTPKFFFDTSSNHSMILSLTSVIPSQFFG